MAQYPKMYRKGVQITSASRSSISLNDINRSGYRVFHKHTSACYSAGHTHSAGCYEEIECGGSYWSDNGIPVCGSCGDRLEEWDTTGNTMPAYNCPVIVERRLICGKTEGASTLICGYEV